MFVYVLLVPLYSPTGGLYRPSWSNLTWLRYVPAPPRIEFGIQLHRPDWLRQKKTWICGSNGASLMFPLCPPGTGESKIIYVTENNLGQGQLWPPCTATGRESFMTRLERMHCRRRYPSFNIPPPNIQTTFFFRWPNFHPATHPFFEVVVEELKALPPFLHAFSHTNLLVYMFCRSRTNIFVICYFSKVLPSLKDVQKDPNKGWCFPFIHLSRCLHLMQDVRTQILWRWSC